EPHAVEPRQTSARAEPEVAVARLDDGLDVVLRKTVAGEPDVMAVLGDQSRRIKAVRRRRLKAEEAAEHQPGNAQRRACRASHPGMGAAVRCRRQYSESHRRFGGSAR